jgi:hypothetical protein
LEIAIAPMVLLFVAAVVLMAKVPSTLAVHARLRRER